MAVVLGLCLLPGLARSAGGAEPEAAVDGRSEVRSTGTVRHLSTVPVPAGFLGNLAWDADSDRLFLVSFGPPSTGWPSSRLLEVDRETGRVLHQADLPFRGSFGTPVVVDGELLQGVYVRSQLFRLGIEEESFGRVEEVARLPRVTDLGDIGARHRLRFPYLEIRSMTPVGEGHMALLSSDIGELITVDAKGIAKADSATGSAHTGSAAADGSAPALLEVVRRVALEPGLSGLARVPSAEGSWYLTSFDPDASAVYSKVRGFNARGSEVDVSAKRSKSAFHSRRTGERTVRWILVDGADGQTLATADVGRWVWSGNLEILAHFDDAGPLGRFHVLALGPEGLSTLEWVP